MLGLVRDRRTNPRNRRPRAPPQPAGGQKAIFLVLPSREAEGGEKNPDSSETPTRRGRERPRPRDSQGGIRLDAGRGAAHCWAHVKRKHDEIADRWPVACAEIDALIGELYAIERSVPGPFPGDAAAQALRRQRRQEQSRGVLDRIWHWATVQVGLPRSEFGKAVRYMLERWEGLTRFVEDPRIPLDNNTIERALRGPAVGRKNHYGSRSLRGTQVAAVFYTLCETAKLAGVDPHAYLLRALYTAIAQPGTVTLPHDLLVSAPTA